MALSAIGATCAHCRTQFRATPKRSFLGFQKLKCFKCAKEFLYPLTSGYRTIYRVVFALTIVGILINVSRGQTPLPGLLGIAAVVALIQDSKLRKTTVASTIKARA